jgi:small neutral amino acid transporter SnatA (MarC family)
MRKDTLYFFSILGSLYVTWFFVIFYNLKSAHPIFYTSGKSEIYFLSLLMGILLSMMSMAIYLGIEKKVRNGRKA